jgi:hypothetical protein
MAVNLIGRDGKQFELDLEGMRLHREAADAKLTFRQHVNAKFPTASDQPETFKQMCVRSGLRFKRDEETGRPASTMREATDSIGYEAATNQTGGTFTSNPAIPDSRILFAPALMEAVENAMQTNEGDATAAFESLVGYRETVAGTRIEQPVIDFSGKGGPEDASFSRQGQNARPNVVLSITAADVSRVIPATSFGLEISDEAMNTGLDLITRTMARFYKKADYAEWVSQLGMILSGNADAANTPMDDGTAALPTFTAQSLDAGVTAAGTLSQKAWLKYFYKESMTMTPDKLVCDWDATYAMEERADRPTNVMNNSTDRMDIPYNVLYPNFADSVGVVVMPAGTFPANTIMGMQSNDAIAKITSSSVSYQAIEAQVMKRSTEMRFDRGFIIYRQYTDAFSVMTLTVT